MSPGRGLFVAAVYESASKYCGTIRRSEYFACVDIAHEANMNEGGLYTLMETPSVPKLPNVAPTKFFSEVASELKKVTWPTRAETVKLTLAVIIISLCVGLFVGGLDILFVNITTAVFK
jgi:preprotein translocase subunit SecE